MVSDGDENVVLISQVPSSSGSCEEYFTLSFLDFVVSLRMLTFVSANRQDQT